MSPAQLDLTESPRHDIGAGILSVASSLFEAVKSAPLGRRANFPEVLRNNNFGFAVRVTSRYAFLEVTSKLRAQKARDQERLAAYRQIFTAKEINGPALFALERSRFARFSGMTLDAPHAFALGADVSLCIWDARSAATVDGRRRVFDIDVLYVVGFGSTIPIEDATQEFDALIRITLADWSSTR